MRFCLGAAVAWVRAGNGEQGRQSLDQGSDDSSCRDAAMNKKQWDELADASLMALGVECYLGFGLWFAPGWSNGGGLPQNVVWPAGMTFMAFVIMMTAALWGASVACSRLDKSGATSRVVGASFAVWLLTGAALAVLSSLLLFARLLVTAKEVWP